MGVLRSVTTESQGLYVRAYRQRKIKEAVEQNRVKWETITFLEGSK